MIYMLKYDKLYIVSQTRGGKAAHLVVIVEQLADVEGDVEIQVMLLRQQAGNVQMNVILYTAGRRLPLSQNNTVSMITNIINKSFLITCKLK